jgi:predicted PurR-regulated permease PerM
VLVVVLAIGTLSATGYFLNAELTAVADKVAGYSSNIGDKLGALEKSSPPWLRHLKYALSDIKQRAQPATPASVAPHVIQALPAAPTVIDQLQPVVPVIDGVVEALLISVLLFFLLFSRKDFMLVRL